MRNRPGWILTLACVLLSSGPARSRAQDVGKDKAAPNTLKAQVEESIGWYQVFVDASATEPMKPQAVLRWGNFTRGKQEADGVFVLWTNKGRPEASVGIYPWYGYITHELVSAVAGCETGGARGGPRRLVAEGPRCRVQGSSRRPRARRDFGWPAPADEGPRRPLRSHDDRLEGRPIGPRRPAHARQTALPCRARQGAEPRPRLDRQRRVWLRPGD